MSNHTSLKVQLGAFDQSLEGWINTDITPHLWIARVPLLPLVLFHLGIINRQRYEQHRLKVFNRMVYLDLRKPLPFADGSVAAFYSSHVFEHLFFDEVRSLIREIHRCLSAGGVCRVVVPDLEKLVGLFNREDPQQFIADLFETDSRREVKNSHHSAYTGPFLRKLFAEAGFRESSILSYRVGVCPDIEKLDIRPESIFFEATK